MRNIHSDVSRGKHKPKSDTREFHGAKKKSLSPKQDKIQEYFDFEEIWNDAKKYPSIYDLTHKLNKTWKAIREKETRYREYQKSNSEMQLPNLVIRKMKNGRLFAIPEELLQQVEFFKFDTKKLVGAKGIVVTSAQYGAALNRGFWESLQGYSKHRGFLLIVLPIRYGKMDPTIEIFPKELKGHVAFDDIPLQNETLNLSTTRMIPTLSRFLTESICRMGGTTSQIMAAPKIELEYRPRMGHNYPKAIMTTGAVTQPNYSLDQMGQQPRTCEIATKEHTYGAVVVEFEGYDMFHFRQLVAGNQGAFYDIDTKAGGARFFTQNGNEHRKNAVKGLVCGDWHVGKTDPVVRSGTFDGKNSVTGILKPASIVLHDFIDGDSVSHWDESNAVRRAYKALVGWDDLETELNAGVAELIWMQKRITGKIHIIPSNHNEFIMQYVQENRWINDPRNFKFCMKLSSAMIEDLEKRKPEKNEASAIDPVAWYFREHVPGIQTYERRDVLLLPKLPRKQEKKQILVSMHGDKAALGGKAAGMNSFQKVGGVRMIIAHIHSANILGPIWRVGTSTYRTEHYMQTPATAWTNSHIIIYENGQRQIINFVNGKWHG